MNTSQTSFLSEITSGDPIPLSTLAYFRQRLRNRLYELVVNEFLKQTRERKLTKAEITRRIRRADTAQVTRWLSAPSNWTIDTISDLLLAMGTEPAEFSVSHLHDQSPRNDDGDHLLSDDSYEWVLASQQPIEAKPAEQEQAISTGLFVRGLNDERDRDRAQPMHTYLQALARSATPG